MRYCISVLGFLSHIIKPLVGLLTVFCSILIVKLILLKNTKLIQAKDTGYHDGLVYSYLSRLPLHGGVHSYTIKQC